MVLFALRVFVSGISRLVYKKYPSGKSGAEMLLIFPDEAGLRIRAA